MEHKQTLWIISAVGVFLLAVIGAALIFYSPSATVVSKGPQELTYSPPVPIAAPVAAAPEPVAAAPVNTTPVGAIPGTPAVTDVNAASTGVTLQEAQYKALLEALAAAVVSKEKAPDAPVPSVTALSSKAREAAAQRPAAVAKPAPASAAAVATPAPVKPAASNQYWIQAAAFTSKNNADNARVALESAKIPGEVFTHTDANGTIVYRVRVGPYSNKSEAEYWQTQIGQLKNFSGAQTFVVKS
jgi:cell division septation protein DedD